MNKNLKVGLSVLFASISLVASELNVKEGVGYRDGIVIEAALSADLLRNINGGVKEESTILGNFDLTIELDTQKVGWWSNGTFFAYFLGNFNSNEGMTNYAGDFQTSSNIEAVEAFRLYEFWYEHAFSDNLSFLVGLHDYNSEFNALEYGSLFINSSFGISPDISQVGPSIFPSAALAARVAYKPTQNSYILAAVYDGIPGDPNHKKRTSIEFNSGEGVFSSIEAGITDGEAHDEDYYKLALGVWYHSAEVENFAGLLDNENKGVYLIGEKTLFHDSTSALGAFFQLGFADSSRNQVDTYLGLGLNYKGLFPGRSDDLLGLAAANAFTSDEYKNFTGTTAESYETAIELTYEAKIYHWLVIQPNIQYIINPSMDSTIDNATVVGARITLVY
jgi:porin